MSDQERLRGDAVSTHSRPKAAGRHFTVFQKLLNRFNSQPPEGGWSRMRAMFITGMGFNSQPPEGGWTATWPQT